MRFQWLLLLGITLFGLGCSLGSSQEDTSPSNPIFGEWEAVSGEFLGKEVEGKETLGMRIAFSPDKATWHFQTPQGEQSYEGYCRIDSSKQPCEIDLRQPKSVDIHRTAYGIYQIEGDTLRISMGQPRPKNFSEPAMSKLVLKRVADQERPHE